MMQANEVRQRFSQIEQTIHQANEACRRSGTATTDLMECIQQLDRQSERARQQLQQSQDDASIVQCVDQLEELGDRARDACERAGSNIDPQLKSAVMQAHNELSQLKRQLH